jgi:hypothetical protein
MTVLAVTEGKLREELTTMRAQVELASVLTESTEEGQILRLATIAIPSLGPCRVVGPLSREVGGFWPRPAPGWPCGAIWK